MAHNGVGFDFGHCAMSQGIAQCPRVLRNTLRLGKGLLYTKGGADPTFASAKVKNAIGRIGIFNLKKGVILKTMVSL